MNSKKLFTELVLKIHLNESVDEINRMILMLMEHEFGLTTSEILTGREVQWNLQTESNWSEYIDRLNHNEPVQYIIGEADLYGRRFKVNRSVLIPRPETEELVYLVINRVKKDYPNGAKILDVGTGSGCIAITLKLELKQSEVFATDISQGALQVASQNARHHAASVTFLHHDVLHDPIPMKNLDILVSNPPYIARHEQVSLKPNVVEFEPHTALFVEDVDPLLFYRALADQGKTALKHGGLAMVEINERLGHETAEVFLQAGYNPVSVIPDLSGKDRIVIATHSPK
ncbi:MAG: peptide chain release factor N(5)-glutamine methyltransferase [Cyclobacteriaceae bacterium]|nr:peptide chain release factor N(5)-glutamine methyltransferase [Cyclobacteriaceae bacterium]